MADENTQGSHACLYFFPFPFVLGFVLAFVSGIWIAVACRSKCVCTADRCCEVNESCPTETPCSCLSFANDAVTTCEAFKNDCGGHESAINLLLTVAVYLCLSPFILMALAFALCISVSLALLVLWLLWFLTTSVFKVFAAIRRVTRRVVSNPSEQSDDTEVELEPIPTNTG